MWPVPKELDDRGVWRRIPIRWYHHYFPAGPLFWSIPPRLRWPNAAINIGVDIGYLTFLVAWISRPASDWAMFAFLALFAISWLFKRFVVRGQFDLISMNPRKYIKPGHCVACGYDLNGLRPEADGCTVCPECGAAWNLGSTP